MDWDENLPERVNTVRLRLHRSSQALASGMRVMRETLLRFGLDRVALFSELIQQQSLIDLV